MVSRIKKGDLVKVVSGKDKGKQGSVLAFDTKKNRVFVKNVNMVTKHVKPKRQGETGGIIKQEASLDVSNVMPICASCKKPARVLAKLLDSATRKRACSNCKETF